jgi:hypothetical protein
MKRSHNAKRSLAAILKKRFSLLHAACPGLRAEWDHIIGSGVSGQWRTEGGDGSAEIQFEDLATRAAFLLPDAGDVAPRVVWLEALRRESLNFSYGRETIESDSEGNERARHLSGTIQRLGEASANYCAVLESRALAAERRAQQQADEQQADEQGADEQGADEQGAAPEEMPESTGRAADEASPANAEATATIVTERRKRGPTRDFETALKVDGVITRLAPDGNWRARLEDICEGLDEAQVRRPKPWKRKGHSTWFDCVISERPLVIKAIEHHLKLAQQSKETFS